MAVKRSVNKSVLLSPNEASLLRSLAFVGDYKSEGEVLREALFHFADKVYDWGMKSVVQYPLDKDGCEKVLENLKQMQKFQQAKEDLRDDLLGKIRDERGEE